MRTYITPYTVEIFPKIGIIVSANYAVIVNNTIAKTQQNLCKT